MRFKFGPIDFTQPSTWRGVAGFAALFGIRLSPELTNQIAIALGAALSAIELFRNEDAARHAPLPPIELQSVPVAVAADRVTVHSPRPLAGEGLGVRVVDSTTDPLTLTLSPRGEGTECESPGFGDR